MLKAPILSVGVYFLIKFIKKDIHLFLTSFFITFAKGSYGKENKRKYIFWNNYHCLYDRCCMYINFLSGGNFKSKK